MRLIAIDPGDKHVGVALFEQEGERVDKWWCVSAYETTPDEAIDTLGALLSDDDVDIVVYEKWRLYGDKASQQTGSEMETSQMIGVIKYLVRRKNEGRPDADRIRVVCQVAEIWKPTESLVRARKIKRTAPKTDGNHAKMAELHGWHFILRTLAGEQEATA